jgi:hypothetical protein
MLAARLVLPRRFRYKPLDAQTTLPRCTAPIYTATFFLFPDIFHLVLISARW